MKAILYFDTEDTLSPPEAGCDDIVLWIADLLSRVGIKGCFHVIGDKARLLEKRSRQDVINAMKRHDVSSHGDRGSVHPMTVEVVDGLQWHDGVAATLTLEDPGMDQIQQTFGKCSALTRHGSTYAPQIVHAAGLRGKMFHGVPFSLPGHRIFWFCDTLCTSQAGLIYPQPGDPPVGRFAEDTFPDTPRFEAQLARFPALLESVARQWDFTAMFGCHPLRLCLSAFCNNYVGGSNASVIVPPPVRPDAEKRIIKQNFTRLVDVLAGFPGVEWVGLDDLARDFGRPPRSIPLVHLKQYAQRVLACDDVPLDSWFSPAELLVGLADALTRAAVDGRWPAHTPVRRVIGPEAMPADASAPAALTQEQIVGFARALVGQVARSAMLPTQVMHQQMALTPAQLLGLLAQVFDACGGSSSPDPALRLPVPTVDQRKAYPRLGDDITPSVLELARWRIFSQATTFESIALHTRLQCWSLKPAHLA